MRNKLLHSLQLKIVVGLVATIVVLTTVYVGWVSWVYHQQYIAKLKESAIQVSDLTLKGLLEVAMLGNHPELLQRAVVHLSADPDVQVTSILDRSGVVRFSSDPQELGRSFDLQDEGCVECHSSNSEDSEPVFHNFEDRQILRYVTHVPNREECHECHDSAEVSRGILIVDTPHVKGAWVRLTVNLYEMIVMAGMTVLATVFMLYVLMNNLVCSRLKILTSATEVLTEHSVDPRVESLEGSDEIGHLAIAFNRMARSLQSYWQELKEKERISASLLDKIVRGEEEQRKHISRELHDHLGQSLSALLLRFQTSLSQEDPSQDQCRIPVEQCHDLETRIRGLIDEVHRLAWEMRPPILDDYGLDVALKRYLNEVSKDLEIDIDYKYSSSSGAGRPPIWVEVSLYRVVQEAVNNILRHAQASRASVVVLGQDHRMTLVVEDNGCGFDPGAVQNRSDGGLGLTGMKERVALCGGTFALESASHTGTRIRVRIPLNEDTGGDPNSTS